MKKIFLLLFITQTLFLFSQQITVTGFVMDERGIPINNVHVVCETSHRGTVSDEAGEFSLKLPEQPTILTLSHVAFVTKQVDVTRSMIEQNKTNGEIDLGIVLKSKTQTLSTVEITDGKVMIGYDDAKKWILDYAFNGKDEILLLLIERNKKYIQLIDGNNKIVAKKQIASKYDGFHKDCFGNIFLKSDDEVCQLFLDEDNNFVLAYQIPTELFLNTIDKIVVVTPNFWYIKEVSVRDQDITYYKLDTLLKQNTLLYNVHDIAGKEIQAHQRDLTKKQTEDNKVMIDEIYYLLKSLAERQMFGIRVHTSMWVQQEVLKSKYDRSNLSTENYKIFYDHLLSIVPYSPLLKINNMLYVFDHVNGKIVSYNVNGNFVKEVEINYHKSKNMAKEIIVDDEGTIAFVKFINDGYVTLRQINPDTGNFTGHDIILEKHAYPKSIKIRGGYVYYLAKGLFENEEKYFLWKQHLE